MVFSTESPPFIYKFDEGFALFHWYRQLLRPVFEYVHSLCPLSLFTRLWTLTPSLPLPLVPLSPKECLTALTLTPKSYSSPSGTPSTTSLIN